jgi:hypothetical protein
MRAKSDLANEKKLVSEEKELLKERNQKLKNFGKVSITKKNPKGTIQDIDFEEIKE